MTIKANVTTYASFLPLASFVLNGLFLAYNLPEVTHPDEQQIVNRVLAMGSGDLNPHYGLYPHLWFYLMLFAQGLGVLFGLGTGLIKSLDDLVVLYFTDPTYFFVVARLLTAAFGAGAVWATWRLGREISETSAWIAALSLTLFAPFVSQAHQAKSDIALVFFTVLCLLACVRSVRTPSSRWTSLWWPAICSGLAASTKYNGVVTFAAVVMALFYQSRVSQSPARNYFCRVLAAGAIAATAFVLTSPFLILDFPLILQGVRNTLTTVIVLERPAPFGRLAYVDLVVENQGWPVLIGALIGWGLVLFSPWGRTYRKTSWILIAFALPYILLIHAVDYRRPHYFLPMAPIVGLGFGIAISRFTALLQTLKASRVTRGLFTFGLALLLFTKSLEATVTVERSFTGPNAAKRITAWFNDHVPPSTQVLIDRSAYVQLRPDRETLRQRMNLWREDGSPKARQLLKAYQYYLDSDLPLRGYRLVPTENYLLNTFVSGYDAERDYCSQRLNGVRYVVVSDRLLGSENEAARRFYQKLREDFELVHQVRTPRGEVILILERQKGSAVLRRERETR